MDSPGSASFGNEGEQVVRLLEQALAVHGAHPSAWLKALFDHAATVRIGFEEDLVTTERLLAAIVGVGSSIESPANSEARALATASEALRRDPERFASVFAKLTPSHGWFQSKRPVQMAFSQNVERALAGAAAMARDKSPDEVTIDDFFKTFPPDESVAARLLAELGLRRRDWSAGSGPPADEGTPHLRGQSASADEFPPSSKLRSEGGVEETLPEPAVDVTDRVTTHADEPASIDQLERAPFASCLAQNIKEARASGEAEASAFIVHLHGPWGSGKSSVLNFLEAELAKEEPPWLVVRFNAWRDQRRQPPWWSLITCIYAGAREKLDRETSRRLWRRWFKWRVRADFMPWVVSAALVVLCAALLILGVTSSIAPIVSALGTTITFIGAGAVAVRSLALGSQRAAQTYADLKADPFQPMTTLFDRLIKEIKRPVAVFIDDLDRCDSGYVVELLEGIQTLMRGAPVTYVVAADRKWICSSFEQRYAKFSPPIGEPGRPLGYLFLDKIFQVSAAVPQLANDIRSSFWHSLLNASNRASNPGEARQAGEEARRAADEQARAALANLTTHEQISSAVKRAEQSGDPIAIQATRAGAAMRITSAEASAEAEHRLKDYAYLLEANPRSMKRLVNAYGMHQATLFLAGRLVPPFALARWTILELRWPLLADFLAVRPHYVDKLRTPLKERELKPVPESLRELFGDELIVEVLGEKSSEDRLHSDALRAILGAVQSDR